MLGLYADNTAAGTHCLDCNGDPADQTAPANRYDYRIHITELIQNFQTDRSLSGNDIFIIKGLHEYCACDFLQILRILIGIIEGISLQLHRNTIASRCFNFRQRSGFRHNDRSLDSHLHAGISDSLCMVSGTCGYHALLALLLCQRMQLMVSSTQLKGTGSLQIFRLDPQIFMQLIRMHQRCFGNNILQYFLGIINI